MMKVRVEQRYNREGQQSQELLFRKDGKINLWQYWSREVGGAQILNNTAAERIIGTDLEGF